MDFIHKIRLTFISPIENDMVIESTGNATDLHININAKKNNLGQPNLTLLKIDNLSRDTRNALSTVENDWRVLVQVGFERSLTPLNTISIGRVTAAYSSPPMRGDITTTLYVREGDYDYNSALVNTRFEGETPIAEVAETIASNFADTEVNSGNIGLGDATLGKKGLTVIGRAANALNTLASAYGFSWSIQEETFIAYSDFSSSERPIAIRADANILRNATPILENILQAVLGVEIITLLQPSLRPYDQVILDSRVNPRLNNTYTITTLTHTVDSHKANWETSMRCLINGDAYLALFK